MTNLLFGHHKEIKERLKRKPFIAAQYRRMYPSYGICGCCGLPFAVAHPHTINYRTNIYMAFFAVCDYCFQHRPLSEIEDATRRLFHSWDPQDHSDRELNEMLEETHKDYDLQNRHQ